MQFRNVFAKKDTFNPKFCFLGSALIDAGKTQAKVGRSKGHRENKATNWLNLDGPHCESRGSFVTQLCLIQEGKESAST